MTRGIRCLAVATLLLGSLFLVRVPGQTRDAGTGWPSFRGRERLGRVGRSPAACRVERPGREEHPLEDADSRPGPFEPGRVGQPPVRLHGHQRRLEPGTEGGPLRRHRVGERREHHRWLVYALDTASGKVLWEKTVHSGVPKIKRHPKSTHANSTLATDGRRPGGDVRVRGPLLLRPRRASSSGRRTSACSTRPTTRCRTRSGSSAAPRSSTRTACWCSATSSRESFLLALNIADGREVWRTPRQDVPTWGTPTVHADGARAQVIVNGYKHAGAYDLATGKEIWRLTGGGDIPVPTPVVAHGLVFLTSAHGPLAPHLRDPA